MDTIVKTQPSLPGASPAVGREATPSLPETMRSLRRRLGIKAVNPIKAGLVFASLGVAWHIGRVVLVQLGRAKPHVIGSLTFPETALIIIIGTAAVAFLLGFGLGHLWNRWAKSNTPAKLLFPSPAVTPATEKAATPSLPEPDRKAPQQPRRLWTLAIIAAVAIVAFLSWRMFFSLLTVSTAPVESNVGEQVFGLGQVGARIESNLGFKVAGVLSELDADQGDRVRAGQVLARLDARDIEAQVAVAKANVAQARANIDKANADVASATANLTNASRISERDAGLMKSGVVSTEQAETNEAAMRVATANVAVAHSELTQADAALQSAQAQQTFEEATLANYTLTAPYDGWVISRNLQLGNSPNPGQSVFTLVQANTVWVVGYVDESLAGRLNVGQPAEIVLRSDPSKRFPGHVARIEIQSDAVNEERLVDVVFDHIPDNIHLAEQAEVFITTAELKQAILVPQTAVTDFANSKGAVWTLENGKIAKRTVTFGPQLLDGRLPVLSGLPEGAAVVLPQSGLRIGRAATVASEPKK